jgi:glycosyltransferase involved in cell wall biosynthesis
MNQVNRSLRIVMVLENNAYPFDVRVRNEAETLAQAGCTVSVICPRDSGQRWREMINGVRVFRFPHPPSGRGVLGYLAEFGYATFATTVLVLWQWVCDGLDVVHVHNPPDTLFIAGILPKLGRVKLVYDHHDLSPELYQSKCKAPNPWLYRALLLLERWSCRLADAVIVVNESYFQNDIERNGVSQDRVWIVRNGPDLRRFYLRNPDAALRSRAGTLIAYLGQMSRQDGIDHLLRALHHLQFDLGHQDWFCVIVGRADNLKEMHRLADKLGVSDRIWFTGYLPDEQMLTYMSSADICVAPDPSSPLNNKSTMNKVMEYMALGKPVVAYDLIEHRASAGDAALYARPNDVLDMARQIARLIDQPAMRIQLGTIGRRRVEQQLAWSKSADRLLDFYAMVADEIASKEHVQQGKP